MVFASNLHNLETNEFAEIVEYTLFCIKLRILIYLTLRLTSYSPVEWMLTFTFKSPHCLEKEERQIRTRQVTSLRNNCKHILSLPGTRSAIAGGTTTLITFAPQKKSEPSLLAALEETHQRAAGNCYSDYSFHLICSNAGPKAISEFPAILAAGISSLKIYMTYEALQLQDNEILDVLFEARQQKITTMIHAENGQVIDWMTKKLEEKKLFDPKYHVTSHPPVAEIEATYRAISLSEFIDVPILIVHVSSPAAAKHISDAQKRGLPVYAETCPQYFTLTRKDLDKPGFEGAKCVG